MEKPRAEPIQPGGALRSPLPCRRAGQRASRDQRLAQGVGVNGSCHTAAMARDQRHGRTPSPGTRRVWPARPHAIARAIRVCCPSEDARWPQNAWQSTQRSWPRRHQNDVHAGLSSCPEVPLHPGSCATPRQPSEPRAPRRLLTDADKLRSRDAKGGSRISPKTALDLRFHSVAGAGFEPATSGL